MFRRGVVVALLAAARVARADVFLSDPVIEIGGMYHYAPTRLDGEMEPMVGTALHVTDRNGVFSEFIGDVVAAGGKQPSDCASEDKDDSGTYCKSEEYIVNGSRRYIRTTWQPIMPDEPEVKIEGVRADFALYKPRNGSNVTGWSLGVLYTFARTPHASVEMGFQWATLRTDVCDASSDAACRYRFAGVLARANYDIGVGTFEAGWDINGRGVFQEEMRAGEYASPIHASFTLDILDRIYVRGEGHASPRTLLEPGFAVEVGGRL